MRPVIAVVALLAVALCTSCLRTTYNRCTEVPPDRECELLDAGTDAGPDANVDAGPGDAAPADAGTVDADVDAGSDTGVDGG
jgi:hypothetical protein